MGLTEVSAFKNSSIVNDDISEIANIDVSKLSGVLPLTGGTLTGDLILGNNKVDCATGDFGEVISLTIKSSLHPIPIAFVSAATFDYGVNVSGNLTINNAAPTINFTDSTENDDFQIKVDGGFFKIIDATNSQDRMVINSNGIVTFGQNVDFSNGIDVSGGDITGTLGSGVIGTTQSAGDNSTKIATTAYVDNAVSSGGGGSASQLTDTNGTVKVEVDTSQINIKDKLNVIDTVSQVIFKNSSGVVGGQLQVYSAATYNTGYFTIQNDNPAGDTKIACRTANDSGSHNKIICRDTFVKIGRAMTASTPTDLNALFPSTGGVELYHIASDGTSTKKFETTANGITVQGSVTTQDINMSNLNASANEVDNTKGSWTIQEGATDLFLINRVNGKKYKFNLTEIS